MALKPTACCLLPAANFLVGVLVTVAFGVDAASAQTVNAEVSVTTGATTESVRAGATQGRVFGETPWLRYYVEGAWATVAGPKSDAFGAAYPYGGGLTPMEMYVEKVFQGERFLGGVRGGRFRTPFGIYATSDHAYGGFIRAPMIRYKQCWALANTFLEHGVNVIAGTSWLQLEATAGKPSDVGEAIRRDGLDKVFRVQGYHAGLTVGASHIRTQPFQTGRWATGRTEFTGFDARWMHGGVQLRGEWITGRPFDGASTKGGYLDAFVHRPVMGPFTAVLRVEKLDYVAATASRSRFFKRATVGGLVRITDGLVGQLNVSHQPGGLAYGDNETAADFALTYTIRFAK
jgi:hypothetical protein